jgi:hypothetical protein
MKTEAHITFDSYDIPGGAQTVLEQVQCGSDVAQIGDEPVLRRLWVRVTLEEKDPRLHALLKLLKQHNADWREYHCDVYTDEELSSARLLVVRPSQGVIICTGTEYGTTYDLKGTCPACGTSAKQTSSLFINAEDLDKLEGQQRALSTFYSDVLVDAQLEADLVRTGATGMFFRDVYAVGPGDRSRKIPFRQLCANRTLPPMAPSTTGLQLDDPCEVCWRNGFCGTTDQSERFVYRAVDLDGTDDVNMSWENQSSARLEPELKDSFLSYPWMVVTPKIWRVFRDAGVTCYEWRPVRVEEGPSITPEERRRYLIEHADTLVLPPLKDEPYTPLIETPERPPRPTFTSMAGGEDFSSDMQRYIMRGVENHYEARQDQFTEEELDRAPLLFMNPRLLRIIDGGFAFGTAYDLGSACPACGSGARQTSALFVNGEEIGELKGDRAGMTRFQHCLVDSGLVQELERAGLSGLSFQNVFAVMRDGSEVKLAWKQIAAARTLPPMAPSTTGFERGEVCGRCHRDGYIVDTAKPTRIVYRQADLREHDDVNLTWENRWHGVLNPELRESTLPAPMLLVTPKVRRIFQAAGASSFYFRPVRVEEG